MGGDQSRCPREIGVHGIAVVLAGDFDLAVREPQDGVIAAPVAKLELIGAPAEGQGDELVPQADAKNGPAAPDSADELDDGPHIFRVARAVGEEDPVRLVEGDLLRGGVPGYHSHIAAPAVQAADNIELDAAVYRHHMKAVSGGAGIPALFTAHPGDGVPGHRNSVQAGQGRLPGDVGSREDGPLAAVGPDGAGELAGVYAPEAGDAVLFQNLRESLGVAEIAGAVVILPTTSAPMVGKRVSKSSSVMP